ncbi:MAG: DUF1415 domain-containing protein [Pseudobdellovibrionaceae bacterium]
MKKLDSNSVISKTKTWIEKTIIGLNLCPFAKAVQIKNQIRYRVSEAANTDELLRDLISELRAIFQADPEKVDTGLLIHPYVLNDFLDYNDFLDIVDAALEEMNLVGIIQVASFHPQYQFAGTQKEDRENYTNRSPYPMLHFLREESVSKAVDGYPDVDLIPTRNIETLNSLDQDHFERLKSLL